MKLYYISLFIILTFSINAIDFSVYYPKLKHLTDKNGVKTEILVTQKQNRRNRYTYRYNIKGRPVYYLDSSGNEEEITLDEQGRVIKINKRYNSVTTDTDIVYKGNIIYLSQYKTTTTTSYLYLQRVYENDILISNKEYKTDGQLKYDFKRGDNKVTLISKLYNNSDSIKEEILYNSNNQIVSRVYANQHRAKYTYDSMNRLSRIDLSSTGRERFKYSYNYLYRGESLHKITKNNDITSDLISTTEYFYRGGSLTGKELIMFTQKSELFRINTSYNSDGQIIKEEFQSKNYPFNFQTVKAYLESKEVNYELHNNEDYLVEQVEYQYNKKEQPELERKSSITSVYHFHRTKRYNEQGKLLESREYSQNGELISGMDYRYNERGDNTFIITYGPMGYITHETEYLYKYDSWGNILEREEYISDNFKEEYKKRVSSEVHTYDYR